MGANGISGASAGSTTSMATTTATSACAACKYLRRKCSADCFFAPYFPADQPQRFLSVHRIFGVSNLSKMLQELPSENREDAVNSLVYEADARVRDPIYGCLGAISVLQQRVLQLQAQLAGAQTEPCINVQGGGSASAVTRISSPSSLQ